MLRIGRALLSVTDKTGIAEFARALAGLDVEILSTEAGAPAVHLSGGAAGVAEASGVSSILLSISHDAHISMASAIAVGVLLTDIGDRRLV